MTYRPFGAAFACATLALAPAQAQRTYSASYVLGDSLSDNGNAADALGFTLPNPPYYNNSFTNGDVAVQVMAQRFGLSANAALFPPSAADPNNTNFPTGGTNFAFAGATAGTSRQQGQPGANLASQLTYLGARFGAAADPNALYTVFIGGNDVRKGVQTQDASYLTEGVASEIGVIQTLLARGARNLLVVNVPDIGGIPEYALENPGQVGLASSYTQTYNATLNTVLNGIAATNRQASIYQFNLYSYDIGLRANAASIGITNTTDPCYTGYPVRSPAPITTSAACGSTNGGTTQAANIGDLYYWDDHHPTAKVHAALGNALADFVASDVPEPASWAMMLAGFGVVGTAMRRSRMRIRFA